MNLCRRLKIGDVVSRCVNRFNVIVTKAVETSGKQFHASKVDFLLPLKKSEVVTQPVKL